MTESSDHRLVSREDDDGTRHIAVVRRSPETDQLDDDAIITELKEWKAKRQPAADAPRDRERWPAPKPFNEWIMATKPGPKEPCPECGCWGLVLGAPPHNPDDEKIICTNSRCEACPWYRG